MAGLEPKLWHMALWMVQAGRPAVSGYHPPYTGGFSSWMCQIHYSSCEVLTAQSCVCGPDQDASDHLLA
jgi:hypothetical protein